MGTHLRSGERYAGYMEEIKWRLNEIERRIALVKARSDFDAIFEVEFCYLQLRFVCELIALASLVAHRSYGLRKELLEEWHADQIFHELEQINEHCFPWPVHVTIKADGGLNIHDEISRILTREDLKMTYGKCGDALHRGRLIHMLKGKQKIYDVSELIRWVRSIAALVREHSIVFPKSGRVMLVNFFGGPNDEVAVLELAADGPFEPQPVTDRAPPPTRGRTRG